MTAKGRFPSGSPQWVRLGRLLAHRRGELDLRFAGSMQGYGGRTAFAEAWDVNIKLIEDLELNHRENFTPLTLRDQIAPAYGVTYESIQDALEGGDLVAAPGTPPHQPPAGLRSRRPRKAAAMPPEASAWTPPPYYDQARTDRIRPYAEPLHQRLAELRASGTGEPSGAGLLDDPLYAHFWDAYRNDRHLSPEDTIAVIAELQADEADEAGRPGGTEPRRGRHLGSA